jgi:hypothetical protein
VKSFQLRRKHCFLSTPLQLIARAEDLPESAVCGWVIGIKGLESTMAEQEHLGTLKHICSDKMPMLTKGLQGFCINQRSHLNMVYQ